MAVAERLGDDIVPYIGGDSVRGEDGLLARDSGEFMAQIFALLRGHLGGLVSMVVRFQKDRRPK